MKSLTGQFVIAAPSLTDSNFLRSVVLMINHDQEGALGVIVNRPLTNSLGEVWNELGVDAACGRTIFLGGPVPGPILVLHGQPDQNGGQVLQGVFLATEREQMQEILLRNDDQCRVVVGYAGWAAGQLESELRTGGWLIFPATASHVFADPANLWHDLIRGVADQVLAAANERLVRPDDPRLN